MIRLAIIDLEFLGAYKNNKNIKKIGENILTLSDSAVKSFVCCKGSESSFGKCSGTFSGRYDIVLCLRRQ